MDLNCVYGVTRKSGKPPRKRLAYVKPTPTTPTPTNGNHDTDISPSSAQVSDLIMTDIPMQPAMINGVDDHNSLEPSFFTPSVENWSLDFGLDLSSFIPATPATEESPSQNLPPSTPPVSTGHDCAGESFEIFKELTAAPSLSEENANAILTQLDGVLQVNRKAIDHLTRVLQCSCCKPPYLVMLHSSIISRLLGLYQQAAGCAHAVRGAAADTAASVETPASGATIGTPISKSSNTETVTSGIPDQVTQLPFSLGTFNIEESCVQFAFKNLLIGNELKRAGSLINLFAEPSPGDEDGGAQGLRANLSAWLRDDHASTVRVLRGAIRELNAGMDL